MKHFIKNPVGRPRLDKDKELMHHYSVRMTDKQATTAIKNGDGNLGQGVRSALEFVARNSEEKKK